MMADSPPHVGAAPGALMAVVDDDGGFRALARRVAEPMGWRVAEYPDGKAFLRDLDAGLAPRLVLLDILMPERDGLETAPALLQAAPQCRLVVATGGEAAFVEVVRWQAERAGAPDPVVLRKPAPLAELRAAIGDAPA